MPKQKQTRKIWICLVEYSSVEVSDPSEMPQFVGKSCTFLVNFERKPLLVNFRAA